MRASTILFNSALVRILHWLNRGEKALTNNTQLLEFNRRSKNEAFANFLIFWGLSSHRRFLYAMIGLSLVELEFYFTRFNMAITFICLLLAELFSSKDSLLYSVMLIVDIIITIKFIKVYTIHFGREGTMFCLLH